MKHVLVALLLILLGFDSHAQNDDAMLNQRIKAADAIQNDSASILETKRILNDKQLSRTNEIEAKVNLIFKLCLVRRFEESIKLCYENINAARQKGDDSAESIYTKLLATNYYYMEQKKQALELFQKAMAMAEKRGYKKIIYNCSSNIGGILIELGDRKNAEPALIYALKTMDQVKVPQKERFITLRLLATLYEETNRKNDAEKLYLDLIEKSIAEKDSLSTSYLYTFYAGLLNSRNETYKAIELVNKALPILRNQNEKKALIAALEMKKGFLVEAHDLQEMVKVDSEIIVIQRDIFTTDLNKEISETEVKYKTAEISYQKNISELQAKKKQQIYIIIFFSILALCLLVFYFLYQRKNAIQKAIVQKERTISIITGEEKERSRIASELHDGVGQMISAAKMNLSALENDINFHNQAQKDRYNNIIQLVDDSCIEVRNISHNMAPYAISQSGLANAIRGFIQKINPNFLNINLHTEGLEEAVDSHVEIVVYRIIQECVNNVIKHAAATNLDIALLRDKEGISATIEDNGKGFDSKKPLNFEGIGLQNIRNRIEYLNGTVEWDTEPGRGTLVALFIPL